MARPESSPIDTLQNQLSGYGADHRMIVIFYDQAMQRLGKPLEEWEHDDLPRAVDVFLDVRFPTVIVCAASLSPLGRKPTRGRGGTRRRTSAASQR